MLKGIYNGILRCAENLPQKIEVVKTSIAEDIAIRKKTSLYKSVSWTKEQQKEFDAFWIENYGRKIPNRWHRLYQAVSGKFCVEYIPEKLYTTKIEPLLNDRRYAAVLEDKSIIEILSNGCDCVIPETIIVCSNGTYYDGNRKPIKEDEVIRILNNEDDYVIKKTINSSSGKDIYFFDCVSDKNVIRDLLMTIGKDFIVQKKIRQHTGYSLFNSTSINTIRITTYIINGEIHHVPLSFRMGRIGKTVDNIHAGGLGIGVLDNGNLLPLAYELGYGNCRKTYINHPDNKTCFSEYNLPYIPNIIKSAYEVHGHFPHIGIISWDYTVNTDNYPVLIEANIIGQGIWFSQMVHGKSAFGKSTKNILNIIRR